ncbi:MAG: LysR substrate-binding domain-containing protein, partial [Rhizobiaceae bacterium]
ADYVEGKTSDTSLVNADTYSFNCSVAMPLDDPLADKEWITPSDLDNKPLATLHSKHEVYKNMERVFFEAGSRLNVRHTTQYFIPLLTYAEMKFTYAIVDPIAVESYRIYKRNNEQLVFKPFSPEVNYQVSILAPNHRPASLLAQSFAEQFTREVIRLGGVQVQ